MKPTILRFTMICFCCAFVLSIPASAQTDQLRFDLSLPGGDVLRPGGSAAPWYIGLDAGLTYSLFSGDKLMLAPLKNPYRPDVLQAQRVAFLESGNGLGFYVGGTIDFPISPSVGIVGKINYHTRSGKFTSTTSESSIRLLPPDTLTINYEQNTTWNFNYLGIDLLLRFQLMEKSLYLLAGPAYTNLSSNAVTLDEKILTPNAYYVEDSQYPDPLIRKITTLNSETEIVNVEKSRWELKLGLGTWIPISPKLFLNPELLFAIPLTKLSPDHNFNMQTIFATVGLRWQM